MSTEMGKCILLSF